MTTVIKIFGFLAVCALSLIPAKKALHMFQQNRYEFYRYTSWLFRKSNFRPSLTLILILFFLLVGNVLKGDLGILLCSIAALAYAWKLYQDEKKQDYVKPLVYTARVKRQIVFLTVLSVLVYLLFYRLRPCLGFCAALLLPYLLIYPMAALTLPLEKAVRQHYENEARKILKESPQLKKIGITGSFGKTSVKNIVGDLLNEHYYTLKTPASYNTPMGITRTVREYLKPTHQVFVCEMGADHVGEISYLMDFVKPTYGMVTSIGPQHLNTFGSLENIIKEKMQAIEKLPADGVGILNVDNPYIRDYPLENKVRTVTVGIHNTDADIVGKDIDYGENGSTFKAVIKGKEYAYETELLGENNVMNCLLAIALALEMGITPEETRKYLKEVRPIEHRLQKKIINGYRFLDNAFNSNPVGCRQSLDVLERMSGKRVIVTPGLIDLGGSEYQENKAFGAYMKGKADFVILVGELEKEALLEGLKESGYPEEQILCVNSEKEAFGYIYTRFTPSDTILLENDLPDAFLK
ncbi:MAG: UDP-N-acetylmuramoyl-tripeptide--D-alanyl-D-alanine ligase [Erysipelotrichaceae bacterium]|nr:UDP-N-acetylmuramoyl-tripeptide--D-alanyl-D-alanine ligase [Erysipelotrichaceae bacterium]